MVDGVDVTIIVNDVACDGFAAEHGLSLWIEAGGKRILFDTGAGTALAGNAARLGIDFRRADALVLSHGHYDHTGGIPSAIERAPAIDVFCHPGATSQRYSVRDGTARPIHMPAAAAAALAAHPAERIHWVTETIDLAPGIALTGPVSRKTSYEDTGGPFFRDPSGLEPDPIEDDMALWVTTPEGAVVCVGCSHAGMVNILEHVRRLSGGAGIRAVIGGFHLLAADETRLKRTAAALRALAPAMVIPCHCTGEPALRTLTDALGERCSPGRAGLTYRL